MTNREIDALIAEHVMGWEDIRNDRQFGHDDWNGDRPSRDKYDLETRCDLPEYSTDISAAWQVWTKIKEEADDGEEDAYCNGIWWDFMSGIELFHSDSSTAAKLAWKITPLAICKAALAAKGVKIEDSTQQS